MDISPSHPGHPTDQAELRRQLYSADRGPGVSAPGRFYIPDRPHAVNVEVDYVVPVHTKPELVQENSPALESLRDIAKTLHVYKGILEHRESLAAGFGAPLNAAAFLARAFQDRQIRVVHPSGVPKTYLPSWPEVIDLVKDGNVDSFRKIGHVDGRFFYAFTVRSMQCEIAEDDYKVIRAGMFNMLGLRTGGPPMDEDRSLELVAVQDVIASVRNITNVASDILKEAGQVNQLLAERQSLILAHLSAANSLESFNIIQGTKTTERTPGPPVGGHAIQTRAPESSPVQVSPSGTTPGSPQALPDIITPGAASLLQAQHDNLAQQDDGFPRILPPPTRSTMAPVPRSTLGCLSGPPPAPYRMQSLDPTAARAPMPPTPFTSPLNIGKLPPMPPPRFVHPGLPTLIARDGPLRQPQPRHPYPPADVRAHEGQQQQQQQQQQNQSPTPIGPPTTPPQQTGSLKRKHIDDETSGSEMRRGDASSSATVTSSGTSASSSPTSAAPAKRHRIAMTGGPKLVLPKMPKSRWTTTPRENARQKSEE